MRDALCDTGICQFALIDGSKILLAFNFFSYTEIRKRKLTTYIQITSFHFAGARKLVLKHIKHKTVTILA